MSFPSIFGWERVSFIPGINETHSHPKIDGFFFSFFFPIFVAVWVGLGG